MESTFETISIISAITTGLLSLAGSSLLISTILRSKRKLSVPYRRIIFGITVLDVFQSSGMASSVFLSPKGVRPWASGNTATCDIQGYFTTVGAIGVPFYMCSLCIYYFCIIILNMKSQRFEKIEPFLHAVPILYSFVCGTFALANHYLNNAGSVCYVAPSPIVCEILPEVECTRGEGASKFRLIFLTYPSILIFCVVCIIMAAIAFSAKKREKRQRRYLIPRSNASARNGQNPEQMSHSPSPVRRSPLSSVLNKKRTSPRNTSRTGEITKQALCFVGSYVLSYGFVWGQSIYILVTASPPPLALRFLASIFFPLQGAINVFIYCRPHVVSLRKKFPDEYTWFEAFIAVLKSGGDDPLIHHERRKIALQRSTCQKSSLRAPNSHSTLSKHTSTESPDLGSNERIAALPLRAEMCEVRSPNTLAIDIDQGKKRSSMNFKCKMRSDYLERNAVEEEVVIQLGGDENDKRLHEVTTTDESSASGFANYGSELSQNDSIDSL